MKKLQKQVIFLFNKCLLNKEGKRFGNSLFLILVFTKTTVSQNDASYQRLFYHTLRYFHNEFFLVFSKKKLFLKGGGELLKRNRMSAYEIVSKSYHQKCKVRE